jgi:glycosyltransferase involved in cell wall biosynthesis
MVEQSGEVLVKTINNFDIVHLAALWSYIGFITVLAARKQKIPYIVSPHGVLVAYALRQKWLKKRVFRLLFENHNLRYAAAIHFASELERDITTHLRLRTPGFVVPNALDCSEFDYKPSTSEARRRLGFPDDSKLISFLGRLHVGKGLPLLIQAFDDIADRFPQARLVLAGPDAGAESRLQQLVVELGLQDRVTFTGYVNSQQRLDLLVSSHLLALTRYSGENFAYSVVEAMAAGVPVLVSENVGVTADVAEEGAGRVVALEKGAIAKAMQETLLDDDKRQIMGKAGYIAARKRYDLRSVARAMLREYERVLA